MEIVRLGTGVSNVKRWLEKYVSKIAHLADIERKKDTCKDFFF